MIKLFKKRIQYKKGFTLIELLVTMVIFVLLTSIVLFSQNGFNNSILLNNLAYDIALTIKQAQTYGTGVKESLLGSTNQFPSYGVYFDKSVLALGTKNFIIFATSTASSNKYESDTDFSCVLNTAQCIQKYTIKNGAFIQSMCTGASNICDTFNLSQLIILFQRPKPDALIYNSNSNPSPKQNYAKIIISSATGATSSIVITSVGQIYVSK